MLMNAPNFVSAGQVTASDDWLRSYCFLVTVTKRGGDSLSRNKPFDLAGHWIICPWAISLFRPKIRLFRTGKRIWRKVLNCINLLLTPLAYSRAICEYPECKGSFVAPFQVRHLSVLAPFLRSVISSSVLRRPHTSLAISAKYFRKRDNRDLQPALHQIF
jgi:hypothetical protein